MTLRLLTKAPSTMRVSSSLLHKQLPQESTSITSMLKSPYVSPKSLTYIPSNMFHSSKPVLELSAQQHTTESYLKNVFRKKLTQEDEYKTPDVVYLSNLEFTTCHGCYPEEKVNPQKFVVNVEIETNFTRAALTDELEGTIDYSKVYGVVSSIMMGSCVNLIEHLAYSIIKDILKQFHPALSVTIEIDKPDAKLENPAGPVKTMGIRMRRNRNEMTEVRHYTESNKETSSRVKRGKSKSTL